MLDQEAHNSVKAAEIKSGKAVEKHNFLYFFFEMSESLDCLCLKHLKQVTRWVKQQEVGTSKAQIYSWKMHIKGGWENDGDWQWVHDWVQQGLMSC